MARPTNKDLQIALTLSGGGYRASVFYIGVLSYLYHLRMDDGTRMLDHVTVMSTVSGGTITGVNYLLALNKGGALNGHLADLFDRIKSNNLADSLLERIDKNKRAATLSTISENVLKSDIVVCPSFDNAEAQKMMASSKCLKANINVVYSDVDMGLSLLNKLRGTGLCYDVKNSDVIVMREEVGKAVVYNINSEQRNLINKKEYIPY